MMKFNIDETFVSLFSIESKSFEKKPTDDSPLPAELEIAPSLHQHEEMKQNKYGVKLALSLKTEFFDLKMEHYFILEFEKKLTKTQQSSTEMKKLFINYLYPYSRAIIISMLANGGYGSVNMPVIAIQ